MAVESTYDFWYESTSLDSMEGVPEWPSPAESKAERTGRGPLAARLHDRFAALGPLLPGVCLALGLAALGGWVAGWLGTSVLGFAKSPISEITVAVILGLVLRNAIGLPAVYEKGLRLCGKEVLRFGIVLIGLRLSLPEVGKLGLAALPVIVGCIAVALVAVTWINRALGLPRRLGSLIAVGTSICGVSAIAATAPVIDAEEDEVSYSVACITLFGLLALFCYPKLANTMFGDDHPERAGLFLGTAIHDTSQVAGAGLMYQEQFTAPKALAAATVTKLTRNVCMAAVIPLVGFLYHRRGEGHGGVPAERVGRLRLAQAVPLFVVGFVLAAAVASVADVGERPFGVLSKAGWKGFKDTALTASQWCLTVAMAAVGLGTGLSRIRRLGWKSFAVGLAAAVIVGGVSAALITVLGPYLSRT
ncbi:MAG TPA: putative sulfate exporter family transporter [Gemmataceae bacterium]|jgi:uncharacterized integral membrane protein (TIGR00698 family)